MIGIRIDRELYGVPIETVREIVRLPPVTPIPDATTDVLGIVNLRGRILAVLDVRRRLGYPPAPASRRSRVLVVESDGRQLGLLVDHASEVMKVPESAIEPPPAEAFESEPDLVRAVAKLEERLVLLLDLERLVSREAMARPGELDAAATAGGPARPAPRPPAEAPPVGAGRDSEGPGAEGR